MPGVDGSFVPAAAADGAATGLAGAAENVAAVAGTAADNAVANGIIQAGEQAGAEGVVNADELAVNAWENEGGALAASETTLQQLRGAATRAAQQVGEGSGSVYGTAAHSAFKAGVEALGNANLRTEVSYLNGEVVRYGTPGSVRLDVVEYAADGRTILGVYDLKTGSAMLTRHASNKFCRSSRRAFPELSLRCGHEKKGI